jgi:hypothetical protein
LCIFIEVPVASQENERLCIFIEVPVASQECERLCIFCIRDIDWVSFYDFDIWFWNCSGDVVG